MRWKGRRQSDNVEDRRSMRGPAIAGGGGLMVLVVIVVAMCMGVDPLALLNLAQNAAPPAVAPQDPAQQAQQDERAAFVAVVLADTEDVWRKLFRDRGKQYVEPKLVLFRDRVQSACGFASAAAGPFYCPADQQVYLDLSFFDEMQQRLGAPGDFAQAYVIAHEVGHHVQRLLGITDEVQAMRQRAGRAEANELSVRLELQADFLAGVWAHHAQQNWQILEDGDIEEALNAASAIGDDRLQRQSQGYVVPDSFTHGSSQQRVRWFLRGLKSGDVSQGDTFEIPYRDL